MRPNASESCYKLGCELRDRTLGIIGLGGIARKLLELILAGRGMNPARKMWLAVASVAHLVASGIYVVKKERV